MIAVQLSEPTFAKLKQLADEQHVAPSQLIERWLSHAEKSHQWHQKILKLASDVQNHQSNVAQIDVDNIIERTRQTRRQLVEIEYADLY